jgi:hypothetical protein
VEQAARAAMLSLHPLALVAHEYIFDTSTSCPTQKARRRTSDTVLVRPKCPPSGPSWHSRSICALRPQPAGIPSRSTPDGTAGQTAQETPRRTVPARREGCGAVQVDGLATNRGRSPHDVPEDSVHGQLQHQGPYEGRCEEVVVFLASAEGISPPNSGSEGRASPAEHEAAANVAAAARHPPRANDGARRRAGGRRVAPQPRKQLSGSGPPVARAGPSPPTKPRRDSGSRGLTGASRRSGSPRSRRASGRASCPGAGSSLAT